MLTIGMPTTVEPIHPTPSQQEVRDMLTMSGLRGSGPRSTCTLPGRVAPGVPVVESPIATLMSRGAAHVLYTGLQGTGVQMGMTVMAHNGAVWVRIQQQRLSKRGQNSADCSA